MERCEDWGWSVENSAIRLVNVVSGVPLRQQPALVHHVYNRPAQALERCRLTVTLLQCVNGCLITGLTGKTEFNGRACAVLRYVEKPHEGSGYQVRLYGAAKPRLVVRSRTAEEGAAEEGQEEIRGSVSMRVTYHASTKTPYEYILLRPKNLVLAVGTRVRLVSEEARQAVRPELQDREWRIEHVPFTSDIGKGVGVADDWQPGAADPDEAGLTEVDESEGYGLVVRTTWPRHGEWEDGSADPRGGQLERVRVPFGAVVVAY